MGGMIAWRKAPYLNLASRFSFELRQRALDDMELSLAVEATGISGQDILCGALFGQAACFGFCNAH
jgi:hypothetical protein